MSVVTPPGPDQGRYRGKVPTLETLLAAPDRPIIHRDLSWLQFNERVLGQAIRRENPLLERLKFLSITASNLDEFFVIRVASLNRSIQLAERQGEHALVQQLSRVRTNLLKRVSWFGHKQRQVLEEIRRELLAHRICIVIDPRRGRDRTLPAELADGVEAIAHRVFSEQMLGALRQPEPFAWAQLNQLNNLTTAVILNAPAHAAMSSESVTSGTPALSWTQIPRTVPSVLQTEHAGWRYWFFKDRLARAFFEQPWLVRVSRDSDFTLEFGDEDSESIPDVVRSRLGGRDRGRPVRLQYGEGGSSAWLTSALDALKLDASQAFSAPVSLGLHGLWSAVSQLPPERAGERALSFAPMVGRMPWPFDRARPAAEIFSVLASRDVLLHHPYDSFETYVRWIEAACSDAQTESIQQTIYRMDATSPLIDALKRAAQSGRIRVRVLIELRARFDEANNLRLADELKRAGVEVAFGFGKLKMHAKLALVTRREGGVLRHYTHLSTGNYNSATARQYTDLAILTSQPEVGTDAQWFFDATSRGEIPTQFGRLVSAPSKMHRRILSLIENETEAARAGRPARIVAKVNALVDEAVCEKLYAASQAGVSVDLIVRGACSLIPKIKGLSERIRVVSVVDRFLEHSRIYYFGDAKVMYLSSADWMPRNFFSRLELAFPVLDERIFAYLEQVVIPLYLGDTVQAQELTARGRWRPRAQQSLSALALDGVRPPIHSQVVLAELAAKNYRGTPLEDR